MHHGRNESRLSLTQEKHTLDLSALPVINLKRNQGQGNQLQDSDILEN